MPVDGVICGGKKGRTIETVEGGDEACVLKESKDALEVLVTT